MPAGWLAGCGGYIHVEVTCLGAAQGGGSRRTDSDSMGLDGSTRRRKQRDSLSGGNSGSGSGAPGRRSVLATVNEKQAPRRSQGRLLQATATSAARVAAREEGKKPAVPLLSARARSSRASPRGDAEGTTVTLGRGSVSAAGGVSTLACGTELCLARCHRCVRHISCRGCVWCRLTDSCFHDR
eukprot:COSAG01_NODE_94_length_26962_cov_9.110933_35_plen_183_part_00